ncbi:efflux transporter outer membrane subunit [Candidatus Nitrotoga fabula]|nr:efflux transporter outer membrane subunit [Candidatus Nitrotoga fabula]
MGFTGCLRTGLMMGCLLFLYGCINVGPDFKRPDPPDVAGYTAQKLPEKTESAPVKLGMAQRFVTRKNVEAEWWKSFGSAKLDALIEQALLASPTLEAAQATLQQARQTYAAQRGATLFPQVSAKLSAQRQEFNPAIFGQQGNSKIFDLYNAGVTVGYNFDLFGGNRRTLESLAAQADYQRYQFEGARLALAANIVTTAISQAQLAEQIKATTSILADEEKQLEITRQRFKLGAVPRNDEFALVTQVEQTRASIPLLRTSLEKTGNLLAVLVGQPPGAAQMPKFFLSDFKLPTELPVVVPSGLVRQRPDIQASEALLHAANARHGAVVSTIYPKIDLSGNLSSLAVATSGLFGAESLIWSIVGQAVQPLINFGYKDEVRAAESGYQAAAANYRQTLLQAFRNVADVLYTLDNDAQVLQARATARTSAQASLMITRQQFSLGGVGYLPLLIAQIQARNAEINLISAQAQRLTDTAALYQAMGGGWMAASGQEGTHQEQPVRLPVQNALHAQSVQHGLSRN